MFTSGSPGAASWFTNNDDICVSGLPDHTKIDNSYGLTSPANVTNVLTVTNVSISNNGTDYTCAQGLYTISDAVFLTVFGELTDL